MDGIKLTLEIFKQKTDTKVIGLSSHYSKTLISKMVKLGASSYLPKNVSIAKLLCTIRRVNSEGFYFDDIQLIGLKKSDLNDQEKKTMLLHGLTDRELDVLGLICEQCTTDQIAEKLFISNKTVERHRSNLFEKTKVKNVVGLVLFALQHKLVERQFMS